MKEYCVTSSAANITSGILALTEDQAGSREHCLDDLGEGLFDVKAPVQFKRGEVFGYDGEVNKALLQEIAPTEEKPLAELSVPEMVERINAAEDLAALEALLLEGEKRKGVITAFDRRQVELEMAGA